MRVECDSCGAKYSISDDKIIGRVFKVRCKKCSNMITVDGTALAGEDGEEATRIFDPSASGGAEAIWYVVIDGSQTGPLTPEEVSEQARLGAIDAETFGWCEGMDDWIQLSDIPALAALVSPAPAAAAPESFDDESTRVVAPGEYDVEGDFAFGRSATSEPKAAPAPAPAPAPFSASVPRATGSEFFTPSAAREPASAGAVASSATAASRAVGQRNESSVLFSLADLTSGSKAAPKTTASEAIPRTEGSGLIDIRVLAAGSGATTAMPALGGPQAPAGGTVSMGAVPIAPLVPIPAKKSNTGLMVALGIAGVVIVGLVAAIVVVLTRPPAPAPVIVQAPAEPAAPAAAAAEATGAAAPTEVAAAAPAEGTAAAAPAEGSAAAPSEGSAVAVAVAEAPAAAAQTPAPGEASRPAATRTEEREPERAPTQTAAATTTRTEAPAEPTTTRPTAERTREREGGDEAVASALSAIRGRSTETTTETRPAPTPAPTPEAAPAPAGLSRSDVQATIRRYGSRVTACGNAESAGQSYRVSFVIQPSGSVTNVSPAQSDDVSTCIAGVVRDMSFPRFEGDPVPVTFPFRL